MDKHNESGSHWVSLFISVTDKIIYYFDSAANEIPNEISKFVKLILLQSNNKLKFSTNIPKQHQYGNTECGMYSLYFLITMLDESMKMKRKIDLFSNKRLNDKFIQSFRKKYFN
jgi:Ulp1 family protease